jgi:hypothetical protein
LRKGGLTSHGSITNKVKGGTEDGEDWTSSTSTPDTTHIEKFDDLSLSAAERAQVFPDTGANEEIIDATQQEIMDINGATGAFEFHGPISAVSFLERLMKLKTSDTDAKKHNMPPNSQEPRQAVNEFQNGSISRQRESMQNSDETLDEDYYPMHAFLFIDSYFKSIHYSYPIIDQEVFLKMAHKLWTGKGQMVGDSWRALYFAVLSLGALTRVWTEPSISGMNRYEWTRLLFSKSENFMGLPGNKTNLIPVQAAIILAQVCQYQLNPNLAYTYLGIALRTAFSCGINRLTKFQNPKFPSDSENLVVSRTWWALYCLEIEMSFIVGRQDMLGMDTYHNRPPPPMVENEFAIIPGMLGLSKIMRGISHHIYWDPRGISAKLRKAKEFQASLEQWLQGLPSSIRPTSCSGDAHALFMLGNHYWPKLQMLILKLRKCCNI